MSCLETLKDLGYRLTPQRMAILETLHASNRHISAEDIYGRVRARHPKVNRSTVYRTLQLLKKLHLVAEADFGEDVLYYHHVEKGHHHHLICQRCGRVTDIDESTLAPFNELLIRRFGFVADIRHLAIVGHCLDCQDQESQAPSSR